MILHDLNIHGVPELKHILVEQDKIKAIAGDRNAFDHLPGELRLELGNTLAFPGFINSHDHLEFNLFPQLGNHVYTNYREWAVDIHTNNKDDIDAVLKVPLRLRIQWGIYKNLLNGFTTVVNHGKKLPVSDDLITIFQHCRSLHSTAFEKGWKWKLNNPFHSGLVAMHIGEGTDKITEREIDEVIRWNIFSKEIIAVHGVAMNKKQAEHFKAVVWCPASNYFLLHKTTAVDTLKNKTVIVFGTDSTLTASWNLWEHLLLAKNSSAVSEDELIAMLTQVPAQLWGLNECGTIAIGKMADIIVTRKTGSFLTGKPEDILLVLHQGNIRLADETIFNSLDITESYRQKFSNIRIGGHSKFMYGDLPALMQEIRSYYDKAFFPVC